MNSQQYSKFLSRENLCVSELVFAVAILARNQWMLVSEVPDGYGDRDVMIEEDFSNMPSGQTRCSDGSARENFIVFML